jgi:hypothetical protein
MYIIYLPGAGSLYYEVGMKKIFKSCLILIQL